MSFARPMREEEYRAVMAVTGVTNVNRDSEGEYTIHLDLHRTPRKQDEVVGEIV